VKNTPFHEFVTELHYDMSLLALYICNFGFVLVPKCTYSTHKTYQDSEWKAILQISWKRKTPKSDHWATHDVTFYIWFLYVCL